MASRWYYAKNGEQHKGPIDSRELLRLATSGELKPTDWVWKEGQKEWIPAKKVRGLFVESEDVPEVPPPVQDSPELGKAAKDFMVALTTKTKMVGGRVAQTAKDWQQKRAEIEPAPPPITTAPAARPVRRHKKQSKLVLIIGAIGLFITFFMCSGLLDPHNKLIQTPSFFGGNATNYRVVEFRKEIRKKFSGSGKIFTKREFYGKYGQPFRVHEYGGKTYLYYRCKDGVAELSVTQTAYRNDKIWVAEVEQAY